MTEQKGISIDMAAVAKVSRRVELRRIVLTELDSSRSPKDVGGVLDVGLRHEHHVKLWGLVGILVESTFDFVGSQEGAQIAKIHAQYLLEYSVKGEEPLVEHEVQQFGTLNGAYHSWPFARELLFNMTARMGLPAFTLPVLNVPIRATAKSEPEGNEAVAKRDASSS